ncbi:MAG: hypothetical protein JXA60_01670 [Candidatus Coatesbacteria bacterium]|nr:hypothetical protein [Candidatus Coatesbacteria bacterium]
MKTTLPVILTFLAGFLMLFGFFIPHYPFNELQSTTLNWGMIISGFTMILGIASLIIHHYFKIARKVRDWQFSIIVYVSYLAVFIVGMVFGINNGLALDPTPTGFVYFYVFEPLQATMFSLLAFYIASASYRAFRARNFEATLLLIAAIIVMIGRVPIGKAIWIYFPDIANWIMTVPNAAAQRGIILGIALGAISMSLRILFGIEKPYMGSSK